MAIEVFEGNTADPKTLTAQITKLKNRSGSPGLSGWRSRHDHLRAHHR
ncbi:transposase domain protein [Mycobacterium kansasii 732]|nr:transposase domain protein [Mycobacterium kansasii 732]